MNLLISLSVIIYIYVFLFVYLFDDCTNRQGNTQTGKAYFPYRDCSHGSTLAHLQYENVLVLNLIYLEYSDYYYYYHFTSKSLYFFLALWKKIYIALHGIFTGTECNVFTKECLISVYGSKEMELSYGELGPHNAQ